MTTTNWRQELEQALRQEPDEEKYLQLSNQSEFWKTCPCGDQCQIHSIEVDPDNNIPVDRKLTGLGYRFHDNTKLRNWSQALSVLDQIEARVGELVRK